MLADDDYKSLATHKVTAEGCPIFLYLVAPETTEHQKLTSPILSRSSSVKSNETTVKFKDEKVAPAKNTAGASAKAKPQEETKVNSKQNAKKTRKHNTNESGEKIKSNKMFPDAQKAHSSKNDVARPTGQVSREEKAKTKGEKTLQVIRVEFEAWKYNFTTFQYE